MVQFANNKTFVLHFQMEDFFPQVTRLMISLGIPLQDEILCCQCNGRFDYIYDLKNHKCLKKICNLCDNVFPSVQHLKTHKYLVHGIGHQCKICENIYCQRTNLLRHINDMHRAKNIRSVLRPKITYKH